MSMSSSSSSSFFTWLYHPSVFVDIPSCCFVFCKGHQCIHLGMDKHSLAFSKHVFSPSLLHYVYVIPWYNEKYSIYSKYFQMRILKFLIRKTLPRFIVHVKLMNSIHKLTVLMYFMWILCSNWTHVKITLHVQHHTILPRGKHGLYNLIDE